MGSGQLAWKLRQDERVIVMERINARHLKATDLPEPMDLVVIDCSFISLRQILPAARDILGEAGDVVALIKPQFEAGKTAVDKGKGVIKDPEIHREVIESLADLCHPRTLYGLERSHSFSHNGAGREQGVPGVAPTSCKFP